MNLYRVCLLLGMHAPKHKMPRWAHNRTINEGTNAQFKNLIGKAIEKGKKLHSSGGEMVHLVTCTR